MDSKEIRKELEMDYLELCSYLQNKYGLCKRAYFCNENCKTKTKDITRGYDGLFIHHIMEFCCDDLGKPWAEHTVFFELLCCEHPLKFFKEEEKKKLYWSFQQPKHLCYCNILEHLILHFKANEIRNQYNTLDSNIISCLCQFDLCSIPAVMYSGSLFAGGVTNHLIPQIEDIYDNLGKIYTTPQQQWRNSVKEVIFNNQKDYLFILKYYKKKKITNKSKENRPLISYILASSLDEEAKLQWVKKYW